MNPHAAWIATAALVVATGTVAQESEPAPIVLPLTASAAGMAASFQSTVNGVFLDTYTFLPASVMGNVSVTLTPLSGPVNFTVALLNGEGFGFDPDAGSSTFSFQSFSTGQAPLQLQVLGFGGDAEAFTPMQAAYRGTVTVQAITAIPEPSTYALLLAGLAATGLVERKRQRGRGASA